MHPIPHRRKAIEMVAHGSEPQLNLASPPKTVAKSKDRTDPPPLKWSTLMYVTGIEEDRYAKEALDDEALGESHLTKTRPSPCLRNRLRRSQGAAPAVLPQPTTENTRPSLWAVVRDP